MPSLNELRTTIRFERIEDIGFEVGIGNVPKVDRVHKREAQET